MFVQPKQKHNSDKMPNSSNVQPALQQTQCKEQGKIGELPDLTFEN